jgi:hypothetical protein
MLKECKLWSPLSYSKEAVVDYRILVAVAVVFAKLIVAKARAVWNKFLQTSNSLVIVLFKSDTKAMFFSK